MAMWDCFGLSEQSPELETNDDFVFTDAKLGVFIVADGMGGRPGGAAASRVAVTSFIEQVRAVEPAARLEVARLRGAVAKANQDVHSIGESDPLMSGLGTTFSAVVTLGARGKVVHIGDSRVYLFRAGELKQLTRDHTLAAELVERKHLTAEQARRFPMQNMLSRALGTQETVEPDIEDLALKTDDYLILATDGLTKAMDAERLRRLVAASAANKSETLCRELLSAAMTTSPADNVTVVVVRLASSTATALDLHAEGSDPGA